MNSNELPDQIHIEQIKKRLWCGREFGQASVLIGAGFSKNANKASYNVSSFPLWQNIAEGMYNALYLSSTDSTNEKIRATSGNGALKLASEYEITFGRSALDDYLLQSIDDDNYYPSKLHESLLSLPWSDIFTTNYDTLLERTRISVCERKYDLVETYLDLSNKMKPRIVKLHGSFPSHRPFIITEEDFRTYPKEFAPFVNMVQQSLMENAFCLIGFSGDDPNFLSWIGWIRDNLGASKPPIYLCGLFELEFSQSQRKLFESKGIVPIDLSPKFPKAEYTDSDIRHKKAIEWFLKELELGEPPNKLNWPTVSGLMEPRQINPLPADNLKQLYEVWQKSRIEYPGWVVAPKKNRDKLWLYTYRWVDPILESIDNLSIPDNLYLVYELNWCLEKTLTPLFFNGWAEKIGQLVEKFNPFPRFLELNNATIRRDDEEFKGFDWKKISECWIELVFALIRYTIEKQDVEMFILWSNRIEKISSEISQEWRVKLSYEKCLFYLFQLDRKNTYKILQNWPEINYLPFWEAKKASILVELGDFKEAEKIARKALYNVRSQINPYNPDFTLLSQEGWLMHLLIIVKNKLLIIKINEDEPAEIENDYAVSYRNRWDKLEAYRCNPYTEIESLFFINGELITYPPGIEIRNTFDGGKSRRYSNISRFNRSRLLSSFSLFRLFEEAAMPINCDDSKSNFISIVNSAKRIMPYASYWSLITIIRSGSTEEIDKLLNRSVVGTLSQEEVNNFGSIFILSLEQLIENLKAVPPSLHPIKSRFLENSVKVVSEVLSRLCIRFSNEELDKLYELTVEMYNLPIVGQRTNLHENLTNLFNRILYTMPQIEILKRMDELLSLPIPTEYGFNVTFPEFWVEPFSYVRLSENENISDFDRSSWDEPIVNLLRIVKNGTVEARSRAVLRLEKLNQSNWLTDTEIEHFVDYLWERIDSKKDLPADVRFLLDYSYLHLLDASKEDRARSSFSNYLISGDFPRMNHSVDQDGTPRISISSEKVSYINEWIGGTEPLFSWQNIKKQKYINWTSSEIVQLLDKVVFWWDEEKCYLRDEEHTFFDFLSVSKRLRSNFVDVLPLISTVILPRIEIGDTVSKFKIIRLLSEMEESGICTLSVLPMLLRIEPNNYYEVAQKIRSGLNSTKEEEIIEAIDGIFSWTVLGNFSTSLKISPPRFPTIHLPQTLHHYSNP